MSSSDANRTYGWDVELACGKCGYSGLPRYEGWSPSLATAVPDTAVYAKVACPKCGRRLTDEAGRKLAELFGAAEIPDSNRRAISRFIAGLFLIPAVLAFVIFLGMKMDWWDWGFGTVWVLLVSAVSIPVFVLLKSRRIESLSSRCECGKPHYIYMGSLENHYCYRCFSCGRLLKLRE